MITHSSDNSSLCDSYVEESMSSRLDKIEHTLKEILSRLDKVEDEVERMVDNDDVLYISQLQDYFDIIKSNDRRM